MILAANGAPPLAPPDRIGAFSCQWIAPLGIPPTGGATNLIAALNRLAGRAIGRIVLFLNRLAALDALSLNLILEAFEASPHLGLKVFRLAGFHAVAVRGDLLSALGGLDPLYESARSAFADLAVRARAIGFEAPSLSPSRQTADRERFNRRAALARDRSGFADVSIAAQVAKGAVYTSITDTYDRLKPQPRWSGVDQIAFLDPPTRDAHGVGTRGWRVAPAPSGIAQPQRASRYFKVNAHIAHPDVEASLWIDASITMVFPCDFQRLAAIFLKDADICVFRHHSRGSIHEEAMACKALKLDSPEVIDAQMDRYQQEGLPKTTGLAELPVILRRHTPPVRALNEAWWREIEEGSRRDQLSFDYVCWKQGVRYDHFPLSIFEWNGLFLKFKRI